MDSDQLLLEQAYTDIKFEQWFNGSKVVDINGVPLKVYHGTQNGKFSEFRLPEEDTDSPFQVGGYFYDTSKHFTNNLGIWFSEDKRVAARFAGIPTDSRAVFICLLSIKNPFIIETYEMLDNIVKDTPSTLDYRAALIEQGYDGIIIDKANTDVAVIRKDFIVFNSSQIWILPDTHKFEDT